MVTGGNGMCPDETRICVGVITGARGLRGDVWLRSYTADPAAVGAYGPLGDASGDRRFELRVISSVDDRIVAHIVGVDDRSAAEALQGTALFVPRRVLPPLTDDEYYHADLLGLAVERADTGEPVGTVVAVHDHGAGAILEVDGPQAMGLMVPFTRIAVPFIDLSARRIVLATDIGLWNEGADPGDLTSVEA
jgi:16S rRNA processing protein RimM